MEISSSTQIQQHQIYEPNPNPQNPNPQNPITDYYQNHSYYYPPPPNPNLPIDQQIQPPGTDPYYPVTQNYTYSYYQDPNAVNGAHFGVNTLNPGVAMGAYPINPPLQTGSKRKNASKKPKVVQSVWCEICKIECNSKDLFEVHKTGKKHNKNLSKLTESASNVPASGPTPSKKLKVVQSIWCEICNIECNTKDVLEVHNKGKKHIKNFSKLKESASNVPGFAPTPASAPYGIPGPSHASAPISVSAPFGIPEPSPASAPISVSAPFGIPEPSPASAPTSVSAPFEIPGPSLSQATSAVPSAAQCPIIGSQENPNTRSATNAKKKRKKVGESRDNLATKTRKVLEGGANATAVITCPVCNVVCNSHTVYKFHLAGQKHATMMKKNVVLTGGAVVI